MVDVDMFNGTLPVHPQIIIYYGHLINIID